MQIWEVFILCGIAGFIDYERDNDLPYFRETGKKMAEEIAHRGPDGEGIWSSRNAVFAHKRLAVIDIDGGKQPMRRTVNGNEFVITYNGELYNAEELRQELKSKGYSFSTTSDTEVLLFTYIEYREKCAEKLNGIFSFAIYDSQREICYACRDRFGVKPFFYFVKDSTFIFGSEVKAIFAYPGIKPELDNNGFCEALGMGPARTAGNGVFKNMKEIKPAHYLIINRDGIKDCVYWSLVSREHTDSFEKTVETVRELLVDSIERQLVSDVPLCTFLSGGLDSSIITAVAASHYSKNHMPPIETYSFDYIDNQKYFTPSAFQPDDDKPWVERVSSYLGTNHRTLICDIESLVDSLDEAVLAKDLPGMADVDSSLLYFCRKVKENNVVAVSGECADEIFGGYPWFHSEKAFKTHAFPWSQDLSIRKNVFSDELLKSINLDEYVNERYEESIASTPRLDGESEEEARRREIAFLNINWFMATLLDRKDRMSMASGLEVRVPFCDHRLVEYVWNIPWKFKSVNGERKTLLRRAAKDILPQDVLQRPKSPYPKTHNPLYEKAVKEKLLGIINEGSSPLLSIIDKDKVKNGLCAAKSDYGKPWFGQLMAAPQMMAYLIQLDVWMRKYNISI